MKGPGRFGLSTALIFIISTSHGLGVGGEPAKPGIAHSENIDAREVR